MDYLPNEDNNKKIQQINVKIDRVNYLDQGLKVFIEELQKENKIYYYTNINNDPCVKKIRKILTKISNEAGSLKQTIESNNPTEIDTMEHLYPSNTGAPRLPPSYMSHISRNEGSRKEGGKSCRKYSKKQRKTRIKKRRSLSR